MYTYVRHIFIPQYKSIEKCMYTYKLRYVRGGGLARVCNAQHFSDKTINWKMRIHLSKCMDHTNKLKINQIIQHLPSFPSKQ